MGLSVSISLIANWIFINPTTLRALAKVFDCFSISLIVCSGKLCGGIVHAESPEWTPASSICSIIPATTDKFLSAITSTSTSMASDKNLSINIGFFPKDEIILLMYWFRDSSLWIISIALPPRTYEGLTKTG